MQHEQLAQAFNSWMDDYANNPERFAAMEEVARQHLVEKGEGREQTYGDSAAATLMAYLNG
jgi:hypothetical protein